MPGEFLCQRGLVDVDTYRARNDAFYQDYLDGKLDVHAYQNFCQEILGRTDMPQLAQWHADFMREHIEPIVLAKGEALVRQHLQCLPPARRRPPAQRSRRSRRR
ncbi:HAD-IB family hydrolase OS=Stutzerimonas stutzeri OX=316 GN=CXK95_14280 PE=4 SV=1 [Stutzerimonas stutzeri]